MAVSRYLDEMESMYGWASTHAFEYDGALNEKALTRAFRQLCQSHPILRARICKDDKGEQFHIEEDESRNITTTDGDVETLRREAGRHWDSSRGVVQLIHVKRRRAGFVGIRIDHRIADGTPYFTFIDQLWRLYTRIVDGCEDVDGCHDPVDKLVRIPAAPTELLRKRWGIKSWQSTAPNIKETTASYCNAIRTRVQLSQGDTDHLGEIAREFGATVGSLVSGVITVEMQPMMNLSKDESKLVKIFSPVDLRAYCSPPVGPTETTLLQAQAVIELSVKHDSDPISIGREIRRQVVSGIESRELLMAWHRSFPAQSEMFHLINNVGRIAPFLTPDGLELKDYLVIPWNRRTRTNMISHQILTILGRLNIYGVYPADHFTVRRAQRTAVDLVDKIGTLMKRSPKVQIDCRT